MVVHASEVLANFVIALSSVTRVSCLKSNPAFFLHLYNSMQVAGTCTDMCHDNRMGTR